MSKFNVSKNEKLTLNDNFAYSLVSLLWLKKLKC